MHMISSEDAREALHYLQTARENRNTRTERVCVEAAQLVLEGRLTTIGRTFADQIIARDMAPATLAPGSAAFWEEERHRP